MKSFHVQLHWRECYAALVNGSMQKTQATESYYRRVLGFGLLQDGDVRVGVLPDGEEIFVSRKRPDARGISICALLCSRLQSVGTRHAQTRQRSRPAVPDNAAVVENLLELGGGSVELSGCEIRLQADDAKPPH